MCVGFSKHRLTARLVQSKSCVGSCWFQSKNRKVKEDNSPLCDVVASQTISEWGLPAAPWGGLCPSQQSHTEKDGCIQKCRAEMQRSDFFYGTSTFSWLWVWIVTHGSSSFVLLNRCIVFFSCFSRLPWNEWSTLPAPGWGEGGVIWRLSVCCVRGLTPRDADGITFDMQLVLVPLFFSFFFFVSAKKDVAVCVQSRASLLNQTFGSGCRRELKQSWKHTTLIREELLFAKPGSPKCFLQENIWEH